MISKRTAFAALSIALASCVLTAGAAGAATERVLYRFRGGSDGALPVANLLRVGGTFYAVTVYGGVGSCKISSRKGCGTVFSVTPKDGQPTAAETVIYTFKGGSDGAYPYAGLIELGGIFYGTTSTGGAYGNGTVFSLTPEGVETVLHSFVGGDDGALPQSSLINVRGTLYGTTVSGGTNSRGTIFSITTTGTETVLHSFGAGSDGVSPGSDLINVHGTLYGVTTEGGSANKGTVYSITTAGSEKILYSFQGGSDGDYPEGSLLNIDRAIYGTASGGIHQGGVVYSITLGGNEKVLHTFDCNTGICGPGSLTGMGNGYYYGPAVESIYSITLDGEVSVVYGFNGGRDGLGPNGLTKMRAKLYGTTIAGGAKGCAAAASDGCGTVFSIQP